MQRCEMEKINKQTKKNCCSEEKESVDSVGLLRNGRASSEGSELIKELKAKVVQKEGVHEAQRGNSTI